MRKLSEKKKAQLVLNKSIQRSHVEKRAQQEMVGFVLIVVLVVIALMIFLVISVRKPVQSTESAKIENLLTTLMKYTTNCTLNSEPNFESVESLMKSCYKIRECKNLGISACDYMNSSLGNILSDVYKSESVYSGYVFSISIATKNSAETESLFEKSEGNCTGNSETGSERVSLDSQTSMNIALKFCV